MLKPSNEEVAKYYKKIDENSEADLSNSNESFADLLKSPSKLTNSKWTVDYAFKNELAKLNAPDDPHEWSESHVQFWISWVIAKFNLTNVKLEDWKMTGTELCQLSHKQVREKIGGNNEHFDIFYTHFEMLRKHRYLAVLDEQERDEGSGSMKRTQKPSKFFFIILNANYKSPF